MSTHGILKEVKDQLTYCNVDGEWKIFKYVELMSHNNHRRRWGDDVNNRCYDPIGLEDVWATKWWLPHQFTFISSVAEVNAVISYAQGKKETADSQITFYCKLAIHGWKLNWSCPTIKIFSCLDKAYKKGPRYWKRAASMSHWCMGFCCRNLEANNTIYLDGNCGMQKLDPHILQE